MKHTQYFNEFLAEEVNLNQSRIDRLNTSVSAVSGFLSRNLSSYDGVERQGSYALRTIIKPVKENHEYDADVLLFMEYDSVEPADYINDLYGCFSDSEIYQEKAHRKTRCVMLDYAGDFHLDVVPCVVVANRYYICNKGTNEFEETDGTGYRDWFNGKNRYTHGNLKRVARLLKYLRDHKSNFTAKSILLTTLMGNTVDDWGDQECFKSLPDALKTVSNRMNVFLQDHPSIPRIYNPALPQEDFTRHWDQSKYDNFRDLFDKYNSRIDDAYDCEDHDDSVDRWRGVFGDRFGKKNGTDGKGKSADVIAPTVLSVTPVKPWAV